MNINEIEALTLKELTKEFSETDVHHVAVREGYTLELARRASKATISAANTAKLSVVIATISIVVVSVVDLLTP